MHHEDHKRMETHFVYRIFFTYQLMLQEIVVFSEKKVFFVKLKIIILCISDVYLCIFIPVHSTFTKNVFCFYEIVRDSIKCFVYVTSCVIYVLVIMCKDNVCNFYMKPVCSRIVGQNHLFLKLSKT